MPTTFVKANRRVKQANGTYSNPISYSTSSESVEMTDGTDLQTKMNSVDTTLGNKADKTATVSTVTYDGTNKKITKTINGTTTDVVTASTLKTDMELNNVGNFKAVSTVASQGLSSTEKANAKANIDLGNVDNTSDANKPISTATQTALDGKADKSATVSTVSYNTTNKKITKTINGTTTDVVSASTLKTDMELNNVGNFKAVSTVASQGLSSTEQSNARANIGLGTSATKAYTTSVTSGSSDLVTSGAVYTAIDNLPEPMVFKGSLGTGGTITTLPTASSANEGYTYKVITAGTYASQAAKIGDLFISDGSSWVYIPSADEPSGTVTSVGISNGGGLSVSDSPITTSGTITISHADTSSQASVNNSGRTYIQDITLDTYGHVTGISSATETVTNTDRYVNSASFAHDSTNDNVKMTLTRAGSDTATVTGNIPKVSSSSAGVAPQGSAVSSQSQSTKFLREDGSWAAPSYTSSLAWGSVTGKPSTYTPSSHTHGNIQNGGTLQTNDVAIANGDKLVITDSSDSSKIARASIAFDGSTATKCLTQKGTWENFTNNAGTVTSVKVGSTSYTPSSGVVSLPAYPTTLPASDVYAWAKASSKPSYAWSEITDKPSSFTPSSHTHGNIQNGGTLQTNDITIASGDKLVVTDSSDSSKIARASISFDGSTATKCLTQKGTWETFASSNTDIKVAQNATDTDDADYKVLFSGTADNTTRTEGARKSSRLYFNPKYGNFTIKNNSLDAFSVITNANQTDTLEHIARVTIGNSTASGTAGNATGRLSIYGSGAYCGSIVSGTLTDNRTFTLPDNSGTIALTSDIVDSKVKQWPSDTSAYNHAYELLFSATEDNATRTEEARKTSKLKFNPYSVTLYMYNTSGKSCFTLDSESYTTSTSATAAMLTIGNNTASGSAGNRFGRIRLYSRKSGYVDLDAADNTAKYTATLQAKTGTIALTSDIPSVTSSVTSGSTSAVTSGGVYSYLNSNIQHGIANSSNMNGFFRMAYIAFPKAFSSTPHLVATPVYNFGNDIKDTYINCNIIDISTTGANVRINTCQGDIGSDNIKIEWIAIGI